MDSKLKSLVTLWAFMGGLVAVMGGLITVIVKASENVVINTTNNIFKD